jgi:hypothetical protein
MEPDGEAILTGNYQALWKRVKGKWFLVLRCINKLTYIDR